MPRTSAFTRFGHFAFSAKPSHGENIYRALVNSYGGQFAMGPGTRSGAIAYAMAMQFARCRYTNARSFNQLNPAKAIELLPVWEQKLAIAPMFAATVPMREADASAVFNRARIGTRANIVSALKDEIGDDFIAFRTLTHAEAVTFPSNPGAGPGNWLTPEVPQKIARLRDFVARVNVPLSVRFEVVSGVSLDVGDVVVVSSNNIGLGERVTVAAVNADRYNLYFTATFTKPHDIGDICTSGPFPYCVSTQLHLLVIVTRSAAESADIRRRINGVMRQLTRGVATWDIVPAGDATHTAQFTPNDPVLGRPGYAMAGPAMTF